MSSERYILPFKGRGRSLSFDQNFLWNSGNIYIMDNHRAAAWCWSDSGLYSKKHSVIHIDQHYDSLRPCDIPSLQQWPCLSNLSFDEYSETLSAAEPITGPPFPVVRWDNFIEIYRQRYSENIIQWYFATYKTGTPPLFGYTCWSNSDLPLNLDKLSDSTEPLILNLDLDYFESKTFGVTANSNAIRKSIANLISDNKDVILTIALSPECCGGWIKAEHQLELLTRELGLDFELPKD